MKIKLLFSCLLAAGTMGTTFAQDTPDPVMTAKIREEGLKHSQVMDIAFHLTDASGPRLSGSPGLKRAQDWAVSTLKSWGLVNATREPWGTFGKGWEVQKNYTAMTVPYYHAIIAIPKAWTPSTKGLIKSEVVYVKIDSMPDLEKYKGKLKGKIIITDARPPAEHNFLTPEANRVTDSALAAMAKATLPPPRNFNGAGGPAGRRGPAAGGNRITAAQLSDFEVAEGVGLILGQARSGSIDGTIFTSNGASYRDTAHVVCPQLETSVEDYQRVLRLVKAGVPVTMEADIKTEFFDKDLQGYNVIAEIPGTDPKLKPQLVMLGAHLDSWHGATGGTDNGAGSSVMMEAVRILKTVGAKPRRTIRIALWSSEEEGDLGSAGYVKNHFADRNDMVLKPEHDKVSAYYNIDNGTGKIRGVFQQANEKVGPIFAQWLEPFHDLGATTVTILNTTSTDHESFDNVGIPGFQFIQDDIDYFARTWHTNQDTYDKIIPADMMQMATIVASFVYNTAQRDEMLPRKPLPAARPARAGR
jgi:carboxypeptidase Q